MGANGDFPSAWAVLAPLHLSRVRMYCHSKVRVAERDLKENLLCFLEFLLVRGEWKLGPEARSLHGSRLASCFPVLLHKLPCLCYVHKISNHVISPSLVSFKEEGCCFNVLPEGFLGYSAFSLLVCIFLPSEVKVLKIKASISRCQWHPLRQPFLSKNFLLSSSFSPLDPETAFWGFCCFWKEAFLFPPATS